MGSWTYSFLIPRTDKDLVISRESLLVFEHGGFKLDSTAMRVLPDEEGYCEPRGSEIVFAEDRYHQALSLLETGTDLLLTYRNRDLYLSLMFARCARSPHIMIGWSTRLFRKMSNESRSLLLEQIAEFAKEIDVFASVFVADPPGYFEDRMVEIDQTLVLVLESPKGGAIPVQEIWTQGDEVEIDLGSALSAGSITGFRRFLVDC